MNRTYDKEQYKNYDEALCYLVEIYRDVKIDMKYKKLIKKQINYLIDHHPMLYQINNIKYISLDKYNDVMV